MPRPPPFALEIPPGVRLVETEYAAGTRYVDSEGVRWVAGRWEKRSGWELAIEDPVIGRPGGARAWRGLDGTQRLAIGTHKKLYHMTGSNVTDITPFEVQTTVTLVNKISTVNTSPVVTIDHTAHGQLSGDIVRFSKPTEVGGIWLEGPYPINVLNANRYTIVFDYPANATANLTGTVTVDTYRATAVNAISTTLGSSNVAFYDPLHGRSIGDAVYIASATPVGGITFFDEYIVTDVPDANTFYFDGGMPATATVTGGGGAISFAYDVHAGVAAATPSYGYGVGPYGKEAWGTPRTKGLLVHARTWSLDNFRDVLIANYRGGAIYEWIPERSVRATVVPNSPATAGAIFVSQQLAVHALFPNAEPHTDRWSHLGDRYLWAPGEDNDARASEVQSDQQFLAGTRFRNQIEIAWTVASAWIVQYTADDFVYDMRQMTGTGGILSTQAHAQLDGSLFWMGPSGIYYFDGAGFGQVDIGDIREFVFGNINLSQAMKVATMVSERFGEICFQYCSSTADELDRWVAIYPRERGIGGMVCGYGTLPLRASWVDKGVFVESIGVSVDGYIYQHDRTGVVDGAGSPIPLRVRTGAFELGTGETALDLFGIIPDAKRLTGTLHVTIYSRDYPQAPEVVNGPYDITATTPIKDLDPRVNGRQFVLKMENNTVGFDCRLGKWRFIAQPGGER